MLKEDNNNNQLKFGIDMTKVIDKRREWQFFNLFIYLS